MARAGSQPLDHGADGTAPDIRLGLIGDNIAASRSPLLHVLAGRLAGLNASYDRLVPRECGRDLDGLLADCAARGYRGVNVTYPYKERAASRVQVDDPAVRALGAVNTVIFGPGAPRGHNTDFSGFIAAYREARGARPAGRVCMIGAGGVGKAIAHALLQSGIEHLTILDLDGDKADDLGRRMAMLAPWLDVAVVRTAGDIGRPHDGFVNCSPVGMVGLEGTPLDRDLLACGTWAFDAVYTPVRTRFLMDAAAEGLQVISGYELFFHQGLDAWRLFSGQPVDARELKRLLVEAGAGPDA
ncbi:MAG: shikimate dehydrogenase [Pseudomonadota bacterium]|nr:shikimate dehydrogenase [Pseudomonadota bacterium]